MVSTAFNALRYVGIVQGWRPVGRSTHGARVPGDEAEEWPAYFARRFRHVFVRSLCRSAMPATSRVPPAEPRLSLPRQFDAVITGPGLGAFAVYPSK
ncbi:hypothetical protein WM40_18300 [Robbsia andropogonis]|uniref:Uncharacterized protein n=1 Tax=Robbsia andropogonis TaxID=28092 RepID=A0A0F5JX18_9BURK|nr:hypothetical protein WM40_18300 [Robbsia andropogonis]